MGNENDIGVAINAVSASLLYLNGIKEDLHVKGGNMSLENAVKLVKDPSITMIGVDNFEIKREVITAQLIVELIDEVRQLRNDLQKMNINR